jgi:hypothetical protein
MSSMHDFEVKKVWWPKVASKASTIRPTMGNRERVEPTNGVHCVPREYHEYLAWLHRSTRISMHPPMSSILIDEQGSDANDSYDEMTRTSVQL